MKSDIHAQPKISGSLRSRLAFTIVFIFAVGGVAVAIAAFAVQYALRPLRHIKRAFAARSSKDLTPVDICVPQEIGGLVRALNHFITRVDRQLDVMRTLIADASHQLRTPIAALRAQAAEEPDRERQLKIVKRVHERSKKFSRLTDQLLSHALIIHRADSVDLVPLDLRKVATEALAQTDRSITQPHQSIRLNLPEEPVICDGDALSLVEACKNLLNNEIIHGQAPITLFVEARKQQVCLGVRNLGAGIAREMWADAGSRFAKNAGGSSKSAGLGLAIVDAVIRAHGGRMEMGYPEKSAVEVRLIMSRSDKML